MTLHLPVLTDAQRQRRSTAKPRPRVLTQQDRRQADQVRERVCRKLVDERDQRHCFFPGCTAFASEKHHILARSLGGEWWPENILSACLVHHRYFKAGLIRVVGNPDDGPVQVEMTALGEQQGVRLPARRKP